MGNLSRHSNERPIQLSKDPSGRLLGCLVCVRGYILRGVLVTVLVCWQSAGVLELFLVRSAEEREKALKKKRKKAQRKTREGGLERTQEDQVRPSLSPVWV